MHTLQMTFVTVLALVMLIPSSQARYLWNPNEQPQSVVHENAAPLQGEHHIISLAPEQPPSSGSSIAPANASGKKDPTSSKQDHATSSSDPKPTANDHKPASASAPAPSSPAKEVKPPPPATHNTGTSAKPDTPKGLTGNSKSGSTSTGTSSSSSSSASDSSSADATSSDSTSTTKPSSSSDGASDGNSSSSGLVAGIVIGMIALIGSIAAFVMVRRKKRTQRDMNPDPFTMGFGSHDPPVTYSHNSISKGNTDMSQPYYQQQHVSTAYTTPAAAAPPSPMTAPSSYPYPQQQQQQPYYASPAPVTDYKTSPQVPAAAVVPPMDHAGYPPQQDNSAESLGVFNVISTYAPTLSDELDIQLGDRIEIMVEYDDGWCQGINLTRGHTKGVFPRHCVEQYPGHSEQQQQQQINKMDGPPQLELGEMKRVSSMYMAYT